MVNHDCTNGLRHRHFHAVVYLHGEGLSLTCRIGVIADPRVLRLSELVMRPISTAALCAGVALAAATLPLSASAQTMGRAYEPVTGVSPHARNHHAPCPNLGGGFIEALVNGFDSAPEPVAYAPAVAPGAASPHAMPVANGLWQAQGAAGQRYASLEPAQPQRMVQRKSTRSSAARPSPTRDRTARAPS